MSRRYKGEKRADWNHCHLCDKPIAEGTKVWLELSNSDSHFYPEGELPAGHESQGCFAFGPSCAPAELRYTAKVKGAAR